MQKHLSQNTGTFNRVLRLAMPVLAEQLLGAMVMLVDFWLVGQFLSRPPELAAITLMAYCMWLLSSMFAFVGIGATALVARFVGGRRFASARRVTNQALLLGLVWSGVVVLLGFLLARPFVALMQLEGETADLAVRYLYILLPVMPLVMVQRVGIACLRGAGDMMTVFVVMSCVNLINALGSAALVTGWGPFPTWGWEGLAVGTAAGYICGGAIVIGLLAGGRAGLKLRPRLIRLDRRLARRILRVGIPGGVDTVLVISCHLWFLGMINNLGDFAAAAHGGAIRVESLAFLPGAAFSMAAATLAGQYLGAGDPHRAGRSVWQAFCLGAGIMGAAALLFFFAGAEIVGLFLDASQRELAVTAGGLLRIASFGMIPMAASMIFSGALRGAGDTRWPLMFTLVGLLGVRIPLAYAFTQPELLNLGIEGAWYAMLIDLYIRCALSGFRFFHGGWKRVVV